MLLTIESASSESLRQFRKKFRFYDAHRLNRETVKLLTMIFSSCLLRLDDQFSSPSPLQSFRCTFVPRHQLHSWLGKSQTHTHTALESCSPKSPSRVLCDMNRLDRPSDYIDYRADRRRRRQLVDYSYMADLLWPPTRWCVCVYVQCRKRKIRRVDLVPQSIAKISFAFQNKKRDQPMVLMSVNPYSIRRVSCSVQFLFF